MKLLNLIIALLLISGSTFSQATGEIVAFNAERLNNAIAISWSPAVEPETNHFEIQKSEDGTNWKVIALMFPFEDGSVSHSYRYNDKSAINASAYYRIRQIDINKKESFSQVKMIGIATGK